MTKKDLDSAVNTLIDTTHDDLLLLWSSINQGQRKQLYKIDSIRAMLNRYGIFEEG